MKSKISFARAAFSLLVICLFISTTSAGLLGLTLEDSPDILSTGIDVVYDSSTDILTATGWATEMDNDGDDTDNLAITGASFGSFSLTASIDDTGSLSSGTLTISGIISDLGFTSGTLLTGTVTNFGFDDEFYSEVLEFVFTATGGDAASLYGSGNGGIVLGFTGFSSSSWGGDFNNNFGMEGWGNALGDVAPIVPEPTSLLLMAGGAMLLKRRRR